MTVPPLRVSGTHVSDTAGDPVASTTMSKPPPDAAFSLAASPARSARSVRNVSCSPRASGRLSLNADEAATVTLTAPLRAMSWASSRPVGPAPKTRAELPGRGLSVSTPCMAHAVGSVNTDVSGSMPSTEKTRLAGITTYSANDPGQFVPSPFRLSHSKVRPIRQYWQCPQFMLGLTETYSPTRKPSG